MVLDDFKSIYYMEWGLHVLGHTVRIRPPASLLRRLLAARAFPVYSAPGHGHTPRRAGRALRHRGLAFRTQWGVGLTVRRTDVGRCAAQPARAPLQDARRARHDARLPHRLIRCIRRWALRGFRLQRVPADVWVHRTVHGRTLRARRAGQVPLQWRADR